MAENKKKFLDQSGTQRVVDKLMLLIDTDSVKHVATPDAAKKKGVYVVSNNASGDKNSASLLVVSVFQSIVMQTWYDNDGSIKKRRSTNGGLLWQDWAGFDPRYEIDGLDERIGAESTRVDGVIANLGASNVNGKTFAEAIEDNITDIGELERTLSTLMNSTKVNDTIDTFKEVENFLQGITDKETLTGLLQEQREQIEEKIPDCKVLRIDRFLTLAITIEKQSTELSSDSDGVEIVANMGSGMIYLKAGGKYYGSWADAEAYGKKTANGVQAEAGKLYTHADEIYVFWAGGLQSLHSEQIKDLQSAVKDLEDAEPEAITDAEIDAMFDGYSMSTDPVAPIH